MARDLTALFTSSLVILLCACKLERLLSHSLLARSNLRTFWNTLHCNITCNILL